ncbi:MAG: DUF2793 domain-containing protein [Sphaerochaetaceae bacterium]|nr:DUF2793 domain-containing protein [Sphaerochaetaceae bacterium]
MSSTLPTLNYTTPEEFVNYYYEKLKDDLAIFDLQISKVGFIGFLLNLLGFTHFDLKQYYDTLFNEAFVGTAQTEEAQYLHASIYGYIPSFATPSVAVGTIEFDMENWLSTRSSNTIRREVIVGYDSSTGSYVYQNNAFSIDDFKFNIDAFYTFVEVKHDGVFYYYANVITSDGVKYTIPSASSLISIPLYSTTQLVKREIQYELPAYDYGTYYTYTISIDSRYYLVGIDIYITEVGSSVEEKYTIKHIKYLEDGNDKSIFLRKNTSTNYILEFGSGIRGKWLSGASSRIIVYTTNGTSGNLIDKTSSKINIEGDVLAFDYKYDANFQLTNVDYTPSILQLPMVDFEYSENGKDPLSGDDLRLEIVNYIQTRDNMISQQDFYNIVSLYYNDFKFLFKKIHVFDNNFYLYKAFRNKFQTIQYSTAHTEPVINFDLPAKLDYNITASAITSMSGTMNTGTYQYFIIAIDSWGKSRPSIVVDANVNNAVGENSVLIEWDHIPLATQYRVYRQYSNYYLRYWEINVTEPVTATYTYTDTGGSGEILPITPQTQELQEFFWRPEFTINGETFISPFVYKGNTRMNYYEGYIMNENQLVNFSEIVLDPDTIGTGFEVPNIYLNLIYDKDTYKTNIVLKSFQTINNLVFTISIYGENYNNVLNVPMKCFPITNNEFVYEYNDLENFGILKDSIQLEIRGGISTSVQTELCEPFIISSSPANVLQIKINDASEEYEESYVTIILTPGTRSATEIAAEINSEFAEDIATVVVDYNGNNRIKLTPLSGDSVYNLFISESGSTCLSALGLNGNDDSPAIFNGEMTCLKFTCKTNNFYQLRDVSDQLRLTRYTNGDNSYLTNIPIISKEIFEQDEEYYIEKIYTFITGVSFDVNRMVTDTIQCRFLNSYLIESPIIESLFVQGAQVFSNVTYNWLDPYITTLHETPSYVLSGSRYLVSTTPLSGSDFEGHENEIATYTSGSWSFYSPVENDFILDSNDNISYMFDGTNWTNIPNIKLPLHLQVVVKIDKLYVQRNNVDLVSEKENLLESIGNYLQQAFTGTDIVYYNSLLVEFIHSGRNYIKSVNVYVTDSSDVPNELNNGIEFRTYDDFFKDLKFKVDIVKFAPIIIYWDVDNIAIQFIIE